MNAFMTGPSGFQTTRASRGRRLDADYDVADLLPRLDVPVRLDDLVQRIASVDERLERSGLDQFLQIPHHLLVVPRNGERDLLATKERRGERQERIQRQRTQVRREVDPARFQQPL